VIPPHKRILENLMRFLEEHRNAISTDLFSLFIFLLFCAALERVGADGRKAWKK